jgi:hypothetical protein
MPESALLIAIAAYGLAGSRTDPPAAPLSPAEWFDLVQGCLAADLVGFLAATAAADRLPVSPGQADELAALDAERAGSSLLVERRAVTVASILAAAGIDHRIVDGPARRLAYADTDVRHVRCVQVLVAGDRFAEAAALQGQSPPGPLDQPVRRGERLVLRAARPGAAGAGVQPVGGLAAVTGLPTDTWPDLDHLGPTSVLALDGREVAVLDLEQQLVMACADVTASPAPALALLRDVAQIALSPGLDPTRARLLADANHLTLALVRGLTRAWSTFQLADQTQLSVWALRMAGACADPAGARPASLSGLAQRMLGRRQPVRSVPALPSVPTSITRAAAATPVRARQSSGRSR